MALSPEYIREMNQDSSEEFWNSFEGFLNKPAPSLRAISKKGKKKASQNKKTAILPSITTKTPVSPDPITANARLKNVKSKVNTGRKKGNQEKSQPIDANLLQQAFAYSSQLKEESSAERFENGGVDDGDGAADGNDNGNQNNDNADGEQ